MKCQCLRSNNWKQDNFYNSKFKEINMGVEPGAREGGRPPLRFGQKAVKNSGKKEVKKKF